MHHSGGRAAAATNLLLAVVSFLQWYDATPYEAIREPSICKL
jgi:hypothetical protein